MNSIKKRIVAGAGSNSYSQGVSILIQLVSVPLFLKYWTLETYGLWLTLITIPSYLAMSDVGIVTVSANKMNILVGEVNHKQANETFQTAQLFVLIISVILLLLVSIAIELPLNSIIADWRWVIYCFAIISIVTLLGNLAAAVYKSTRRYALGVFYEANCRMFEWLGGMICLLCFGTILSVALGMLAAKLVSILIMARKATKGQDVFSWGIKRANYKQFKSLWKPSLYYMIFPLGNAVSIQGYTVLTATWLGASSVAIFNTYRTIFRVIVQASSIFSHAGWPEFSRCYGEKRWSDLKVLFNHVWVASVILSFSICAISYFATPWILSSWGAGKISYLPNLVVLFFLYAIVASFWHVPRIFLMATNDLSKLAPIYLLSAITGIGIGSYLASMYQLYGFLLGMIISEGVMLVSSICLVIRKFSSLNSTEILVK